MEKIFSDLLSSLLPLEIYQHFAIVSIAEHPHGVEIRLEEYEELLPSPLINKDRVVLDGYCNPLELLHFSMKWKPLYLKLYRRKCNGGKTKDRKQYYIYTDRNLLIYRILE